jgi:hypothetical protein
MAFSDAIEKLGRRIFEAPFGGSKLSEEAPELAEIRLAVLDAVKSKSHRAGPVRVFPFEIVRIHLRGIPEEQAGAFESGFLGECLAQDLRKALTRASVRFSGDLRVEVRTVAKLPVEGETWVWVETDVKEPAAVAPEAAQARRTARLVVMHGAANQPELLLNKARVNIGRTVDVYRAEGPSRRNDLAFVEDNDINRTVSREHAHILVHKKSGECRIFNDRWYRAGNKTEASCGLWIIRDGLSQAVHRNSRGVVLNAGDEIHLGRAVVRFAVR